MQHLPSGTGPGKGTAGGAGGNRLLAVLPRAKRDLLEPMLTHLALLPGEMLLAPGQWIERIIFPDSGIVALIAESSAGGRVCVEFLGKEGLVGLPALLGMPSSPLRACVLVEGKARSIATERLRALADRDFALRDLMRRHAMASIAQLAYNTACGALHPLRQRTARCLLELQDRAGPGFALTQDWLACLVGARRPTVNQVLGQLRQEALISLARGAVAVADPEGLEAAACPCRRTIRELRLGLLPHSFT